MREHRPRLFTPYIVDGSASSLDMTPLSTQIAPGGRAYVLYEAFQSGDLGGTGYRRVYVAERTP